MVHPISKVISNFLNENSSRRLRARSTLGLTSSLDVAVHRKRLIIARKKRTMKSSDRIVRYLKATALTWTLLEPSSMMGYPIWRSPIPISLNGSPIEELSKSTENSGDLINEETRNLWSRCFGETPAQGRLEQSTSPKKIYGSPPATIWSGSTGIPVKKQSFLMTSPESHPRSLGFSSDSWTDTICVSPLRVDTYLGPPGESTLRPTYPSIGGTPGLPLCRKLHFGDV